MILVDAGVVIRHLRRPTDELPRLLKTQRLALVGVTRAEIVHGCRSEADRVATVGLLDSFIPVPTPEEVWDALGRRMMTLRQRGFALPIADVLVAPLAIKADAPVWTLDGHFQLLTSVFSSLRLWHGDAAT